MAVGQAADGVAVAIKPIPDSATFVLESINCGKAACSRCAGAKRGHGPYWYAKWETGGRERAKMHAIYIGKAPKSATPDELRAFYAARQAKRGAGPSGNASSGTTGGNTGGADCFSSRRPLDADFATLGIKRGASFADAKRAYLDAIQKAHPDRGGSDEQAKCINAAWDRLKRFFGKR